MSDKTRNDRITLAIPFYRGTEYLERAIRSVLAQADSRWELLICDDAGPAGDLTDFLSGIIGDRPYHYVRGEQGLGMAGNWNRCLDRAETDLVTLLHADDELLPNYVEKMLAAAKQHPEVAAHFCAAKIIGPTGAPVFSFADFVKPFLNPGGKRDFILSDESALTALLRGNFIMCPTLCYRKSRIGARRFDPAWKMVLDLDFTTRLLLDGLELHGIPDVAYAYRRHPENATAQYTEDLSRFDEEIRLYDRLAWQARERGWAEAARIGDHKRIIRLHLLFRISQDLLRGRLAAGVKKLRYLSSMS